MLGLDPARITFEAPGVNHCVWMTHFRYDGEDAYPILDRWIAKESAAYWREPGARYSRTQLSPAAIDMYRLYGLLPLGDTSRAIWPEAWWYHLDIATKRRWWGEPHGGFDSDEGWAAYLQALAEAVERMRAAAEDPAVRLTELFPPRASGEQIVPLVDALLNDHHGDFIVNVPNNGALKGLPDDVVVEVPAVADGKGIRPQIVGRLPEPVLLGATYPQWLAMKRRLTGFRSGDPRYLLQVLLADNRTRTREHAEETLAAMMAMPGNEAMAAHFGAAGMAARMAVAPPERFP